MNERDSVPRSRRRPRPSRAACRESRAEPAHRQQEESKMSSSSSSSSISSRRHHQYHARRRCMRSTCALSLLLVLLGLSSLTCRLVSAGSAAAAAEEQSRHEKFQAAALAFAGYDRHHGARQPEPAEQTPSTSPQRPQQPQPPAPPSLDDTLFCTTHRHLHLAVGPDPSTSMTVSFSSEPCDYGHPNPPRAGVMVGTSPHRLDRLVLEQQPSGAAPSTSRSRSSSIGAISPRRYNATMKHHKGTVHERYELYESEWQRHVTVTGLRPDTTYYYRPVILKAGGGSLAAGLRPDLREEQDAREGLLAAEGSDSDSDSGEVGTEQKQKEEEEVDLLYEQEQEEIVRDGGEEEDQRRLGLHVDVGGRELERLFRLAEEAEHAEVDAEGAVASLRATRDVAPPPAYKSHPYPYHNKDRYRNLHMSPKQTAAYVEDQIAAVEHKIEKGVLESDGTPSFRTAPPSNVDAHLAYHHPTASPIKFAIIGDVAQTRPALDTLSLLNDNCDDISTVLLVGDIAYANGVHELWDTWFDMVDMYGRVFHHKPLMVAPGNHEVERDSKSNTIFASYENRFLMPQVMPVHGGNKGIDVGSLPTYRHSVNPNAIPYPLPYDFGNAFYSFKQGPTHNIVLNSFGNFKPGSAQYKWFVKELQSVDRDVTPWLTVTLHCPLYNTFKWHRKDKQTVLARKYLEDLMYEHRVNFVLSGHLHAYMRTVPVYKNKADKRGPIHIILGNGGRQANTPYYNNKPEEWIAVRDHTTYGYGTLEFVNVTHARYEWVQSDANDISTLKVRIKEEDSTTRAKDRGIKDKLYVKNQLYL